MKCQKEKLFTRLFFCSTVFSIDERFLFVFVGVSVGALEC
jgi:hypothetical protein